MNPHPREHSIGNLLHKILLGIVLLSANAVHAGLVLTVDRDGFYEAGYQYGGANIRSFSNYLDEFASVEFGDFDDLATMLTYDSIWIPFADQEQTLTPLESANLSAFIATGRRVFMHGENFHWKTWNDSMLALVGAVSSPTRVSNGVAVSLADHELTTGAKFIYIIGGGRIDAAQAVSLYSQEAIHLWGDNVVSVLEASMFSNSYSDRWQNDRFIRNLAGWLGADFAPVPVPGTFGLVLLAIFLARNTGVIRDLR